MKKINKAITGIDKSGSFRVYMAVTTKLVEDARLIHETSPLATHLLGRTLTGAGLMGLMMREPGFKLTLQLKGEGPAQQVLCTASSDGAVKGYIANPKVELPAKADGSPDVGGALGLGVLTCIRDTGLKEPYVGRIDFVSGEVADDLTAYFFISEQQQTSVSLGVRLADDGSVEAAGGMILQVLPDASEEAISALEEWLPKMPKITELVCGAAGVGHLSGSETEEISAVAQAERLLKAAFSGMPEDFEVTALDMPDIGWECDCSEERLEQVVLSLGAKEIRNIIEEDGQAELTCQFCRRKYHFDKSHLERLLYEGIRQKLN